MSQSLREGGFRTASAEASLPFLRSHVRKMILEKNRKKKIKIFFFLTNSVQSRGKTQISKYLYGDY